jgi:toxin-antitoxin system PIN domain toxin
VIAVDTNVLVYAHREDSSHHRRARASLEGLVERGASWALPWPCLHEFLAIVTHPRVYDPPSGIDDALGALSDLLSLPKVVQLTETPDHADVLGRLLRQSRVVGPKVHDARVAALCLAHGVSELWTADRDFSYFPELRTHNPLTDGH